MVKGIEILIFAEHMVSIKPEQMIADMKLYIYHNSFSSLAAVKPCLFIY